MTYYYRRRYKGNGMNNRQERKEWDLTAVIMALISTGALIVTLFSNPKMTLIGHTIVFSSGILAPAVIMGAIFWASIEILTIRTKTFLDAVGKAILGYILGLIVGGFLGYEFKFGYYVIIPAYSGNIMALIYLIVIFAFTMIVIWDASWSHNHNYVRRH